MWWPPYVFFLTCYSAWRLSFWLLNVCLLLLLTPGFLIQNSARSLQRRTRRPSSLVMSGKAWHVVQSVLPPKWQARHSSPLEDHPSGKKNQLQKGRVHLPVLPLSVSPSAQGVLWENHRTRQCGRTSSKIFVSCNFFVLFQIHKG